MTLPKKDRQALQRQWAIHWNALTDETPATKTNGVPILPSTAFQARRDRPSKYTREHPNGVAVPDLKAGYYYNKATSTSETVTLNLGTTLYTVPYCTSALLYFAYRAGLNVREALENYGRDSQCTA